MCQGCWHDVKKNERIANIRHDTSYNNFFKRYPFLKGAADSTSDSDSILSIECYFGLKHIAIIALSPFYIGYLLPKIDWYCIEVIKNILLP